MTLATSDAETENLPPVPSSTTLAPAARTPLRPVFVDDGGRRKQLLARAGYVAGASFLCYLIVIGLSLTALPTDRIAAIAPPTVAAVPSTDPRASSTGETEPPRPAAAPTPGVAAILAAPAPAPAPVPRPYPSVSRSPATTRTAPSTRRAHDIDGTQAATSRLTSTTSRPPTTSAQPTATATSAAPR